MFAGVALSIVGAGGEPAGAGVPSRLLRVELHLVPDARVRPHVLLMTLGGPVYCGQLLELSQFLDASRLCPDYGLDGERSGASRAARREDWGDAAYLNAVARLPARLQADGVKVAKLVLIGASYAGYANTELVATHPELHPAALIVVDSFFDLSSRTRALYVPSGAETLKEIESVLGGTLAQVPQEFAARSPSSHLEGLTTAIRQGTRFVDVWSISPEEQREFNGATCSRAANARWLSELAGLLERPIAGYVTHLRHGDALRHWGESLLTLAGLARGYHGLPARRVTFAPGKPVPADSYCH
jgi:pimeloyl-ACP methyl ester carboxylesterase